MSGNQLRKNGAGAVIHDDINNHAFLNIPMVIDEQHGIVYEVLSAGFHSGDALAMVTTDGFTTTRVNIPIITIKNDDNTVQAYRLPLELEEWVLACMQAASAGKNLFPSKVAFGIIENKFYVEFK